MKKGANSRTALQKFENIQKVQSKLEIVKANELLKALNSHDPEEIFKANQKLVANVQEKDDSSRKSFVIDPNQFISYMGYKDKPYTLSYMILRRMARGSMVINSIIKTRQDQIAAFCEPQQDKYSTGFIIRKKKKLFQPETEPTLQEQKRIEYLTEFVLNCGEGDSYDADDFDSFVRKIVWDSYVYDQMNFEIENNRKGFPHALYAVDAATIRLADSYDDEDYQRYYSYIRRGLQPDANVRFKQKKLGYYPSYCQILDSTIVTEFYPWELCFGVRNPSSNIYLNGYGLSELEDLVNTVTSMLWAEEYNRRFFSQGSAPKGLIKIKSGSINSQALQQFKQQWLSMLTGVMNAWRTPVLEADMDWIDLQKSNVDMQFDHYQEFLIKISCAVYRIDPAEINFPLSGGSEQKAMFEGNNEARLKHSKDKGLYPFLKFLQRRLNKFVIQRLDPDYELIFCGMDNISVADELDQDIKKMQNFMTFNEIRKQRNLPSIEGGDIPANPIYFQQLMQKQQMQMMAQQQQGNEEEGEEGENEEPEENPFQKALETYLTKLQPAA